MTEFQPNMLALIAVAAGLGMVPFAVITMTSFVKISVVMFLIRNALGIQQTPPNMVLYGIALVLTIYITMPVLGASYANLADDRLDFQNFADFQVAAERAGQPIREHLLRFTEPEQRAFFFSATEQIWPEEARRTASDEDLLILIPSFMISELTRAFEIGFLLYLPFVVIDLIVSNILMAMGMMMMSPVVISVPFKLFLFVLVDGWTRLLHGLVLSYG